MATIKELAKKQFIIPIYQRNYAWTDVEIHQLIDDILNAPSGKYHIGSLVLFDKGNNTFEVTDGQQRLTTLALILFTLKEKEYFLNVRFEAREENNQVLKELATDALPKEDNELIYALKQFIEPKIENIKESFTEKLLNSVVVNENILPETVNLHHYFERMNSRGKQLEFHSVLRAKLLQNVDDDFKFQKWDKCSELDRYSNFDNVENDKIGKETLSSILKDIDESQDYSNKNKNNSDEKYGSIIDFANFLLIALRIFKNDSEISLNDKQLLQDFGYYKDSLVVEPKEFLAFLIELKELFDKFIIKRSFNDNEPYWVLLNDGKNTFSKTEPKNTEEETEINNLQQQLIKIQSMLHATYPSNNYKEWLLKVLATIWENRNNTDEFIGKELLEKLISFAKEKVKKHLNTHNLPIEKGLNIRRIVFYYTDYLLWKLYVDEVRGEKNIEDSKYPDKNLLKKISKNKQLFKGFNFRSFSSIEHLYPQNPDNKKYIDESSLNSFGNLCLISRSSNSRYSNLEPTAKREHSKNGNLNESLKQAIMFQALEDDKNWNTEQIKEHEKEIKELIDYFTEQ